MKVESEENSTTSSDMQGQFGAISVRNPANVNIKVRYSDVRFNR
ncbi:hypothetical protein [Hymenobacter cellulosilyticus]|nr:hypothetical protein [Hymenobacter cellulosilyticus]